MEARPTTRYERECLVEIITPRERIRKFFVEKRFDFLTSVPQPLPGCFCQFLDLLIDSMCATVREGEQPGYPDSEGAAGDAVHPGERQGRADSDRGRDYDSEGAAPTHRTLEKRLTAFYGQPMDKIGRPEVDWGTAESGEVW